jgi:hypothetical protein
MTVNRESEIRRQALVSFQDADRFARYRERFLRADDEATAAPVEQPWPEAARTPTSR